MKLKDRLFGKDPNPRGPFHLCPWCGKPKRKWESCYNPLCWINQPEAFKGPEPERLW